MGAIMNPDKFSTMLKISDDKDVISDTTLLMKYINNHNTIVNWKYRKYWDAYSCRARIFNKQLVPRKAMNKPDYRISVNYPRYIVDTYTGFARGIPVKMSAEDSDVNDYITYVAEGNELDDVIAEVHALKCIFGEAYQIIYINEDAEIGTVPVSPMESFPIFDNSIRPRVRYFVRTYFDEDNKQHGTISDDVNVYYFDIVGGQIVFTEERPHGFEDVPVIVYKMNNARIGLIETVLSMCDAYDKAISEKMNDVDSFSDCIMKVLGATLSPDQINELRSKRIINIGGKDGKDTVVEFLSRPSGDSTQEHLLERLERLIFTVSMVINTSDDSFATTSGIALKMKMQPMANLAARDWRLDQSSIKKFWRLVFSNPINSFDADAWRSVRLVNTLNYPEDVADSANIAKSLDSIVSHKTQLEILPASIVPDVDEELKRIEAEATETETETEEDIETIENQADEVDVDIVEDVDE